MKQIILFLFCFCLFANTYGQPKKLEAGDTMPRYLLDSFYREPRKSLDIYDLRGKLVILDFWNVQCKACIASMPKMDSLQKLLGDSIQVLLITYNSHDEIDKLFAKIKLKRPGLPIVTSRNLYINYFPHEGDPLHVWVRPDGVIEYLAEAYNSTSDNIRKVLRGSISPEINSRKVLPGYNRSSSFFSQASLLPTDNVDSYSLLLSGMHLYQNIRGEGGSVRFDSVTGKAISVCAFNMPIIRLYSLAFSPDLFGFDPGNHLLFFNNRILDETGNHLDGPQDRNRIDTWRNENVYSYEARINSSRPGNVYQFMQEDISRYFDYKSAIEKRNVKCLVLVKGDNFNKVKKDQQERHRLFYDQNGLSIINEPFALFIKELVYALQQYPQPFIDGTGYKGTISLNITGNISEITNLKKELHKYGLDLVEKILPINMLVIKNKRTGKL